VLLLFSLQLDGETHILQYRVLMLIIESGTEMCMSFYVPCCWQITVLNCFYDFPLLEEDDGG